MKTLYIVFASGVFFLFCTLEMKGVALDLNETAPQPNIYSSRGGGGGGGGFFYATTGGGGGYYNSK